MQIPWSGASPGKQCGGGGGGGYWAKTQTTTITYGPPQSPPPLHNNKYHQTHSHEVHTNKNQTNGSTALTNHGHRGIFDELTPSSFPPGTDPEVMAYFQEVDRDGNGLIDGKELKQALSSYSSTFSLRTVRLLMFAFTKSTTKVIGPKEFISVYYGLQQWKAMFQMFDRDENEKIDPSELREALHNIGYPVSETLLGMLISTFGKKGGHMAIGFDGFIECCVKVKGLSDKFKEKDHLHNGTATFTYENFMMSVLPYIVV